MGNTLRAAVVQMSSQDDLAKNLERATELVGRAAGAGAKVVLLPENFAYLGAEEGKRAVAEKIAREPLGPILTAMAEVARREKVHVIAGGMPEQSGAPDRPYNTCAVVDPSGAVVASYRKVHLFDVEVGDGQRYCESASTTPGDTPIVTKVDGVTVGLSVCYDVRFPELYRKLVDLGAEALVVPAAFTLATGKDHWHVLLRARAIESQCYVLAAAQWGTHPRGRRTYGKSLIVDPWGEVIAQCSEGEAFAIADIDRDYLQSVRKNLPSLMHRRF